MHGVTAEDRRKELQNLLNEIQAHPERDHTAARERIAVLRKVLEVKDPAGA